MSFWRIEETKHKWVTHPEQHAKQLLLSFLWGRFGKTILIFDEIRAGAGFVDIFVASPSDERAIIELKMCGAPYALSYAKDGLVQIEHYMENKNAGKGFLLVFDARMRDFGKDIPREAADDAPIHWKVIDVRPSIK
jgi:hypothetical protein